MLYCKGKIIVKFVFILIHVSYIWIKELGQ